ncbi:MAG: phytanoyl-CoA dioxygenase family protein [Rhodococcus sp. (in: high G+C Gram-positive bacteria)]|uniref:phytanoyl-CoA dioxygenase family protein n=1 Tax=Rhodococcus sp. TaxID=1831 RepID=UPI002ADACF53|nr:phytanoyl-CoA dioxygenase family protein [Rhodococcus sp. (in: high G+C Gram-positive bacteria)]
MPETEIRATRGWEFVLMVVTADRYHTRVTASPIAYQRPDPVLWDPEMRTRYADFEVNGFTHLDGVLDDRQVRGCLSEVRRLGEEPALRGDERIVREKGSSAVRSIFDIANLSLVVSDAIEESGAAAMAAEILGSQVYVHQSRLNYKPGFRGGAFYWHADFEAWHAEDGMPAPRAVSASIALTDNHHFNGPLMVMPGSHRTFLQCAGATPPRYFEESLVDEIPRVGVPNEQMISEQYDQHGIEVVTGAAGSMTVFDSNLLHASAGNISPVPRANIFVVFNSVDNALEPPFCGAAPRPEFLAARR